LYIRCSTPFIRGSMAAPERSAHSRTWSDSICRGCSSPAASIPITSARPPRSLRMRSTLPAESSHHPASRTTTNSGDSFALPSLPDSHGHFGPFGGKYVAETLMPALTELEQAYKEARRDPAFKRELEYRSREFVGRPTPLYHAANLTARLGGAKIYLKR